MCSNPTCYLEFCVTSYGYCHCGCGGKTTIAVQNNKRNNLQEGVPKRYILGHHSRKTTPEYLVNEETGCWEWQGFCTKKGYGHKSYKGTTVRAHRHYYEKLVGPVPDGLVLDHLCKNKKCVNPTHLEPVTNKENLNRR